jgi:hypothetical protein
MSDDELITAVKESVTGVHMDIPAGQIVSRSRAIRARRRIPTVAGALALAAGGGTGRANTAARQPSAQPSRPRPAGRVDGHQARRRQHPGHHPPTA